MQKFLHGLLSWTLWKATQVAQKLPKDWEDQCEQSFFHKAYAIKEEDIPANFTRHNLFMHLETEWHGPRQAQSKWLLLEWTRSEPSHCLSLLPPTGPSFHFKQFSRVKQSFPCQLQACLTMTMQWKPGSNLSFQGQKPTGLIRKPYTHLWTIFLHLILLEGKSSSDFQLSRKASGKLTSGRSTILRNVRIGCMSNIQMSSLTSCQEAAQEFTNPVMLGFNNHSNYQQGSLTMKILSTIFWKSWTKATLCQASMIALELFAIRACDGCGMCIKLWTIKNSLKWYVGSWIKMRSYLFF